MDLTTVEKVLFKNVMPWLRTDLCVTLLRRERTSERERERERERENDEHYEDKCR